MRLIVPCLLLASLLSLEGREVEPTAGLDRGRVFLFASVDCPISNRYAPEVIRLHRQFSAQGVDFALVYADPSQDAEEIRQHLDEFAYPLPAYRDPQQRFAQQVGATVTPEAAVFDASGRLVYLGRIDDQYVDFGQRRAAPTERTLANILESLVAGERLTLTKARAIGCYLPPID